MTLLRRFLYLLAFYGGTLVLLPVGVLAAALGQRPVIAVARWWGQWHGGCCRYLLGISSVVEGQVPPGACIIAIKHESFYEALQVPVRFERPAIVLKRELTDLPIWGWIVRRHGGIPVDRAAGSAALRTMVRAAQAAVAAGRPIIIFPEGTRVEAGTAPPLKPGLAGLYKVLGLPVVPIAVNSGRLLPRGQSPRGGGVVTWKIAPAIPAGLPRAEMEALVFAGINALNPAAADRSGA